MCKEKDEREEKNGQDRGYANQADHHTGGHGASPPDSLQPIHTSLRVLTHQERATTILPPPSPLVNESKREMRKTRTKLRANDPPHAHFACSGSSLQALSFSKSSPSPFSKIE
jgi:hypothetical protein